MENALNVFGAAEYNLPGFNRLRIVIESSQRHCSIYPRFDYG